MFSGIFHIFGAQIRANLKRWHAGRLDRGYRLFSAGSSTSSVRNPRGANSLRRAAGLPHSAHPGGGVSKVFLDAATLKVVAAFNVPGFRASNGRCCTSGCLRTQFASHGSCVPWQLRAAYGTERCLRTSSGTAIPAKERGRAVALLNAGSPVGVAVRGPNAPIRDTSCHPANGCASRTTQVFYLVAPLLEQVRSAPFVLLHRPACPPRPSSALS